VEKKPFFKKRFSEAIPSVLLLFYSALFNTFNIISESLSSEVGWGCGGGCNEQRKQQQPQRTTQRNNTANAIPIPNKQQKINNISPVGNNNQHGKQQRMEQQQHHQCKNASNKMHPITIK
jgi:hypothetical protein